MACTEMGNIGQCILRGNNKVTCSLFSKYVHLAYLAHDMQ